MLKCKLIDSGDQPSQPFWHWSYDILAELSQYHGCWCPVGRFKNTYELSNLRALKISTLYKNRIFQCMGKIFCLEFQRFPLKFHSKYLAHTLKDVVFIHSYNLSALRFKSSYVFWNDPQAPHVHKCQHIWYWICRIYSYCSSMRKYLNYPMSYHWQKW